MNKVITREKQQIKIKKQFVLDLINTYKFILEILITIQKMNMKNF